jgi:peptide/nickel transport system substrate-binding protein
MSIITHFSATEKVLFGIFALILTVSALSAAWQVNKQFLVAVPAEGGSLVEAVVGLPRSINPVLAQTDVDRDISGLIYAGLMKFDGDMIVPDLAERYSVSEDGLTYTFTLREDARFHDGTPVTADDVEFTIQKIQDVTVKSPRRIDWSYVTVQKISPTVIELTTKQPYAPFLSNTTIGILPKHLWRDVANEQFGYTTLNLEPVGAGPYKFSDMTQDSSGVPSSYTVSAWNRYQGGRPYVSKIVFKFFESEADAVGAFLDGSVTSVGGVSPVEASKIAKTRPDAKIVSEPMSRIFGIFFNTNQSPALAQKEARQALSIMAPRQEIVDKVLMGYGIPVKSPIPGKVADVSNDNIDAAKKLLDRGGWVMDANKEVLVKTVKKEKIPLEFTIATTDAPELKAAAELVKASWESIGAKVTIKVFEYGDLYQNIIRPRKYDALLFGEVIGKDQDIYAFWHSSQRNAPGLNLAQYTNSSVDNILTEARATLDTEKREASYAQFEKIVMDEVPAVLLYSPDYIYAVSNGVGGVSLENIALPSDRWHSVSKWHTATEYVWKVFVNYNLI